MIEKVIEGKAYVNNEFIECCIGVEEERIVAVKKVLMGEKTLRFRKGLILPAAVDVHVHFRDPGFPRKEDFFTGTMAAAFGGVSCVFDMPNNNPPATTLASCKRKVSLVERKACIDFGIYAGVTTKNLERLSDLAKIVSAFKVFLGESTNTAAFDQELLSILASKPLGRVVAFHAEDDKCLSMNKVREENLKDHVLSRPSECEKVAVEKIIKCFSSSTRHRVHLCHVSSSAAIESLSKKPKNFTVGVTPHHLLLASDGELPLQQTYYKVNPPLRGSKDRDSLWNALFSGVIDIVESDHAPHTVEEKEMEFEKAPSGLPGVETMLPLMLYQFTKRGIPLSRLISLMCEKPAETFGVNKGRIASGNDADLIVVDLKDVERVNVDELHSRCG
ncbi:MAG TPA: amidohydrolase, partial [Thermoplasmatales archaeon]|nr:amidohydrolase [Thermoplasmatales archaeon]